MCVRVCLRVCLRTSAFESTAASVKASNDTPTLKILLTAGRSSLHSPRIAARYLDRCRPPRLFPCATDAQPQPHDDDDDDDDDGDGGAGQQADVEGGGQCGEQHGSECLLPSFVLNLIENLIILA